MTRTALPRRRTRPARPARRARGDAAPDVETRQRLLEAATALFAGQGFSQVTVRDICRRAGANVAAVNYYFGGKEGLYLEVVHACIAVMRETQAIAERAAAGLPPEERLRAYMSSFLGRVMNVTRPSWIHQLITREMNDPTPALDLIVAEAIQPRIDYLGALLAELLKCPPDDPRVSNCMASIWGQWLVFMPDKSRDRLWPRGRGSAEIEASVEHITTFSLAGIRAMASR